ncbi:hypothetical protein [Geobacter sp. AOG1]|uniref:hypothetical protein n=1 Tax=Geobacter sp. AOG1 TaxID=1566346 RepID=UPI001CC4D416|nr:hypothetical protein [Geobacter sp. AOG1]
MKREDIKKLKIALILVLLFVLLKSSNEIGAVGSTKALVTSLALGLPIILLIYRSYDRFEKVTGTVKRSIAYLSVPISLGVWRWLHMVSKYYETVLALILCYLLILSIYMESVPPAQPSNEMKSDQKW